jgi:hypothetical protein
MPKMTGAAIVAMQINIAIALSTHESGLGWRICNDDEWRMGFLAQWL